MQKVTFEQFRKENRERARDLGLIRLENPLGRPIRTKPRDPRELRMLLKLASNQKDKALKSGKYRIISSRRWRIGGKHT